MGIDIRFGWFPFFEFWRETLVVVVVVGMCCSAFENCTVEGCTFGISYKFYIPLDLFFYRNFKYI